MCPFIHPPIIHSFIIHPTIIHLHHPSNHLSNHLSFICHWNKPIPLSPKSLSLDWTCYLCSDQPLVPEGIQTGNLLLWDVNHFTAMNINNSNHLFGEKRKSDILSGAPCSWHFPSGVNQGWWRFCFAESRLWLFLFAVNMTFLCFVLCEIVCVCMCVW